MPTNNELTLNELVFGPDSLFSETLEDMIIDLVLGRVPEIDPKFANLLQQTLSAVKDEQCRISRSEQHTVTSFGRIQVFSILTVTLLSTWIDTLPRKRDRSATQQKVLHLLLTADDVFAAASKDVQENHPDVWAGTELPLSGLAQKIWFHVWEVTAIECEQLANRFTAMLQAEITK